LQEIIGNSDELKKLAAEAGVSAEGSGADETKEG